MGHKCIIAVEILGQENAAGGQTVGGSQFESGMPNFMGMAGEKGGRVRQM